MARKVEGEQREAGELRGLERVVERLLGAAEAVDEDTPLGSSSTEANGELEVDAVDFDRDAGQEISTPMLRVGGSVANWAGRFSWFACSASPTSST